MVELAAGARPLLSIVIPVYNEEAILRAAVVDLIDRLSSLPWSYELLIAENGSTDRTMAVAADLAERFDQLVTRHTDEPNYGKALREGIRHARGDIVICDERHSKRPTPRSFFPSFTVPTARTAPFKGFARCSIFPMWGPG